MRLGALPKPGYRRASPPRPSETPRALYLARSLQGQSFPLSRPAPFRSPANRLAPPANTAAPCWSPPARIALPAGGRARGRRKSARQAKPEKRRTARRTAVPIAALMPRRSLQAASSSAFASTAHLTPFRPAEFHHGSGTYIFSLLSLAALVPRTRASAHHMNSFAENDQEAACRAEPTTKVSGRSAAYSGNSIGPNNGSCQALREFTKFPFFLQRFAMSRHYPAYWLDRPTDDSPSQASSAVLWGCRKDGGERPWESRAPHDSRSAVPRRLPS